jgi:hypothetical protein
VPRADNLTTFMCRFSGILGATNSWNPQGLSRFVQGLLYLFALIKCMKKSYDYWRYTIDCGRGWGGGENDITMKLTAFRRVSGSMKACYWELSKETLVAFMWKSSHALLVYGTEQWTLKKPQKTKNVASEMYFLREFVAYRLMDNEGNEATVTKLNKT